MINLMHKDRLLASFNMVNKHHIADVSNAVVYKSTVAYLPGTIKWALNDKGMIARETNDSYILNEDGCNQIMVWIENRQIPVNRHNYNKYFQENQSALDLLIDSHAFAFTDCYWIKSSDETDLTWKELRASMSCLEEYPVVSSSGKYHRHNTSLNGELEKFWFKENGNLMLCKKNEDLAEMLSIRELFANLVYEKQGFTDYCKYRPEVDPNGYIRGCICQSFIPNDNLELITAYDLLEEYNLTQQQNTYQLIAECAARHGLAKDITESYLDRMLLMDFIVNDRDRHLGNIGFIRDSETMQIISPAPVYDSGSSASFEDSKKSRGLDTEVNGIEKTFRQILGSVNNINVLNTSKLPTEQELRVLLEYSGNMSDRKKDDIVMIYRESLGILKQLQNQIQKSQDKTIDKRPESSYPSFSEQTTSAEDMEIDGEDNYDDPGEL